MTQAPDKKSQIQKGFSFLMLLTTLALIGAVFWNWAALGWPEWAWLIAYLIMFAIRFPHGVRNAKNTIVADSNNAFESAMLAAMFLTMGLLPLFGLTAWANWLSFADYSLPQWAQIIGAVLLLPFLWLFWKSHTDLGQNWSPGLEVHEEHKLVTAGIYASIRHPMYAAIWLAAIAQPLLVTNWIYGALVIPAFALMYFVRVPREEAMMITQFGDDYEAYKSRSGRIWPKFGASNPS